MRPGLPGLLAAALACAACAAHAETYKCTRDGQTVYQDHACDQQSTSKTIADNVRAAGPLEGCYKVHNNRRPESMVIVKTVPGSGIELYGVAADGVPRLQGKLERSSEATMETASGSIGGVFEFDDGVNLIDPTRERSHLGIYIVSRGPKKGQVVSTMYGGLERTACPGAAPAAARPPGDLFEARRNYATRLTKRMPAPQGYVPEKPPAGVREISYLSHGLILKAWIAGLPPPGASAPAVVFLHGGFAFARDDWDMAQAIVKAGYVLMMPRLRGENGGEGQFELFGGEVDDAIAAGNDLAARPGVDKNRIYLMGHSIGGSLAMLVAELASPYKAVAALSGYAYLPAMIRDEGNDAPFDLNQPAEFAIRNPSLYAGSLKAPIYLFTESANANAIAVNKNFCALVARVSFCQHEVITGDHESMIQPSIARALALFGK